VYLSHSAGSNGLDSGTHLPPLDSTWQPPPTVPQPVPSLAHLLFPSKPSPAVDKHISKPLPHTSKMCHNQHISKMLPEFGPSSILTKKNENSQLTQHGTIMHRMVFFHQGLTQPRIPKHNWQRHSSWQYQHDLVVISDLQFLLERWL
jgi:hypothetical protein